MRHPGEHLPKEKILNFKIYIIYKNLKVRIYILTRRSSNTILEFSLKPRSLQFFPPPLLAILITLPDLL